MSLGGTSTVRAGAGPKERARFARHEGFSVDSSPQIMGGRTGKGHKSPENTADPPTIAAYIVDPSTMTAYLKGKFLGKGGFAQVHELTDLTTNTVYAGKIIPKSRIVNTYHREKIIREIDLHRLLKHENVVRFHRFFEDDENVYIILENCSRKSLVHVLRCRQMLTEPEVRYYLRQLITGLQYIHNHNVIHRDLKLGNMFLTENLIVKIGDFGLASRIDAAPAKKATICGTPNYIAPEVLNKQGHSCEADTWAVGCIMYAMLVGQPPFQTVSVKETYSRITSNNYSIPSLVSKSAQSLIMELLHPEPSSRPSLASVLQHKFFSDGFEPSCLPKSAYTTVPKFPCGETCISRSAISPTTPEPSQQSSLTHELRKLTKTMTQLCVASKSDKLKTAVGKPPKTSVSKKEPRLPSAIRQRINSVLCCEKNTSKKTKVITSSALYQLLSTCMDSMPKGTVAPVPLVQGVALLFVTKWIDYSNKYGFGYQLSDKCIGVLFNDSTKMSFTSDRSRVECLDTGGRVVIHSAASVPAVYQDRYTLLKYFTKYMDENLTECGGVKPTNSKRAAPIPHMHRWIRTALAIVMQLSTGTIQVNFFEDHSKIIMSEENQDQIVTYIDENRQALSYRLHQLVQCGCPPLLQQRLVFVLDMLREFAQLDSSEV